jgi:hypothetical protein
VRPCWWNSIYGRSVWWATIARRPDIVELPQEPAEILTGVIGDGGGLVRSQRTGLTARSRNVHVRVVVREPGSLSCLACALCEHLYEIIAISLDIESCPFYGEM